MKKPTTNLKEKSNEELLEKVKKDALTTPKKARPNHYWIRPRLVGDDAYGLSNHGYSKWKDCPDNLCCAFDYSSQKWLTGLDEDDPILFTSGKSQEEIEQRQAEIKELREDLEKKTGLNLSPHNHEFWQEYIITLSDKSKPFIPHLNARDRIAIEVLKRRGDIAFGSHDLYNDKYANSKFYIETEEAQLSNKNTKRRLEKEAIAAAFDLEKDYEKLWSICYLLQLTKTHNESAPSLIDKLDEYVERNSKYPEELEKLINLNNMDRQELDALTMFRKAVRLGVIKFDRETKVYHRGGFNMKATEKESVRHMLLPDNAQYYVEIITELDEKEHRIANTL